MRLTPKSSLGSSRLAARTVAHARSKTAHTVRKPLLLRTQCIAFHHLHIHRGWCVQAGVGWVGWIGRYEQEGELARAYAGRAVDVIVAIINGVRWIQI